MSGRKPAVNIKEEANRRDRKNRFQGGDKMTDAQTLRDTAARIKELAGHLEEILAKDTGAKAVIKIIASALFDPGINEDDLYALIELSLYTDSESGITVKVHHDYRPRSVRKLETRGYVKRVSSDESGCVYELCGPERCLKLPPIASAVWEDARLSFYDRLVYAALCCFSNTFGKGAAQSIKKIANAIKCREGCAREALRSLEHHGLITAERRPGGSNIYRLNESAYEGQAREE
jgi:DNA-binding MarR family transcriptional regulator